MKPKVRLWRFGLFHWMFTLLCASPGRSFIRIIALKRGTSYPGGWHACLASQRNFSLFFLLLLLFFSFSLSLSPSLRFEVAPASVFARKFSLRVLYERAKIRASFPRFLLLSSSFLSPCFPVFLFLFPHSFSLLPEPLPLFFLISFFFSLFCLLCVCVWRAPLALQLSLGLWLDICV